MAAIFSRRIFFLLPSEVDGRRHERVIAGASPLPRPGLQGNQLCSEPGPGSEPGGRLGKAYRKGTLSRPSSRGQPNGRANRPASDLLPDQGGPKA
jgi:hypothetical protein